MVKKLSIASLILASGISIASAQNIYLDLNGIDNPGSISYNVMPYGANLNYTGDTNKDSGYVYGIYGSMYDNQTFVVPYKLELDVEGTKVKYNDSTPSLKQSDLTIMYHNYAFSNIDMIAGFHYIDSDDQLTDQGQIYKLGILYYKTLNYNIGANLYYSNYTNLSTSPKIAQITLKGGKTLGNFYFSSNLKYIRSLSKKEENKLKNSYSSIEAAITYYPNSMFSITLGGWIGKKAFAVDNDGFVVNNLSTIQKSAYYSKVGININKTQKLSIGYSRTTFEGINNNAYTNVITGSYSLSF